MKDEVKKYEQTPYANSNDYICMPRAVGYSMAIQLCYEYKKIMERLTKEDNDD